MSSKKISSQAILRNYSRLEKKYYVYAYYSGNDIIPIYVGKGIKDRCLAHLDEFRNEKNLKVYIIKENLTEEEAYKIESACIDLIGVDKLKNKVKGHHSEKHIANQLLVEEELKIDQVPNKSLIIYLSEKALINQDISMMDDLELYDRARYCWSSSRVSGGLNKLNTYKYVFIAFKKHIITVYKNIHWFKAGTTQLFKREKEKIRNNRYEFVGKIDNKLSKKFAGMYYFKESWHFGGGLDVLKE